MKTDTERAIYTIRTQAFKRVDKDNTESNIVVQKEAPSVVVQNINYKDLLQNATALYPSRQEAIADISRSIHIALKKQKITPKYMFRFTRTLSVVDCSFALDNQTA